MDLSKVKAKLQSFEKPAKREKVDYSKIYFKPKPGKHQIRIVPSKLDKATPFKEIYFHYGFEKFPMLALSNWGEKDPIVEVAQGLRKTKDPENWKLAKKIDPKMRVFVPVIVRGEESQGTRLWEFGVEVYKQLLNIADDDDYGDYTSIDEGRDFTITVAKENIAGREVNKVTSISIKPKTSPITEDAALLQRILDEQPNILELNKKYSFAELKEVIEKWIGETEEEANDLPFEEEDDAPSATQAIAPTKKSNTDKFDEAFK